MSHLEFPYRIVCTEEGCEFDEDADTMEEVVKKSEEHFEDNNGSNVNHKITVLNLIIYKW